jgi:hypothetical protein
MTPKEKRQLPPMTVARVKEASMLIERLVEEKTDVFLRHVQGYKTKHREATNRPLTPQEAAQIAAAMVEVITEEGDAVGDRIAAAERVQGSTLRAYDEPGPKEVLLRAGASTAPEAIDAALRLVALVEMDAQRFRDAREADYLDSAIADDCAELEELEASEARERATAALEHFATATGRSKGEAWGLLVRVVVQALTEAVQTSSSETSTTEQSTSSLVDTTGLGETFSTPHPGETP